MVIKLIKVIKLKTAVQIGAGNIGRGFMAQIFRDSGYRIVFIDVNPDLVKAINIQGKYNIELVSNQGAEVKEIDQITAVSGRELEAAAGAVAEADIIAIAVGVAALAKIMPMLVAGFRLRWQNGNLTPLNILICENLLDAPGYVRGLLREYLTPEEQIRLEESVGLIETSIGRMVPGNNSPADGDLLSIKVEPYCRLPADQNGFRGGIPDLKYLEPFSPFIYYIQRKLYVHNFGHAILAYLGYVSGKNFIWEVMTDQTIRLICRYTLEQVAKGLEAEHGVDSHKTTGHIDDLMSRFTNRALGDTTERVGRDPSRKLGPEDRIIGAYRLLSKHNLDLTAIPLVIAAGLSFHPPGDEGACQVQDLLKNSGIAGVLEQVCGLRPEEKIALLPKVQEYDQRLKTEPGVLLGEISSKLNQLTP